MFVDSTGITVGWVPMGEGMTYDVARGDVDGLSDNMPAKCLSTGSPETYFDDAQMPDPGGAYYYLVRANSECGEGTWGTDSIGQLRTTICP